MEKPELMGLKLKKGGNSTPSPKWKFDFQTNKDLILPNIITTPATSLSARKLGACLWEALPPHTAMVKMSHGGASRHRRKGKDKGLKNPAQSDKALDTPYHYEEPRRTSNSSLKREIAASLIQHHRSVERNSRALQPVSPASYYSSMEVTPFNHPLSPHSLLGLESKIGNSRFNLQTSKEFVTILNRIWALEEEHTSNISLVNSMKRELDQSHMRIKVLLRQKNKEQEIAKATIKSTREELEDEKKLRKQSESLHKKLARELLDTKTSFADTLKEYEREKKARFLLENLCDEFSKGIRGYEQQVRQIKQKPEKELMNRENSDKLILHLSEAWLDERMQMKENDAKDTILDKLSVEIETFLRAKAAKHYLKGEKLKLSLKKPIGRSLRRHSSESFHLHEATSAPNDAKYEDDCTSSNSNCFQSHQKNKAKSKTSKMVSSRKKQGKIEGVWDPRVNSNRVVDKLIGKQVLSLEEETQRDNNEVSKATSKWVFNGSKDSTLKAKLLEARLEGQHSHSKVLDGSA